MPSSILNSDDGVISGTSGLKSSGGDDGALAVQSNGTEVAKFKTTELVINDGGANYDFRVEGDTNANLLVADASADAVGIGVSSPAAILNVDVGAPGGADKTLGIFQSETSRRIGFVWDDSASTLGIATLTNNAIAFHTNGNSNERVRIDTSGNLLVGTTSATAKLTVVDNTSPRISCGGSGGTKANGGTLVIPITSQGGCIVMVHNSRTTGANQFTSRVFAVCGRAGQGYTVTQLSTKDGDAGMGFTLAANGSNAELLYTNTAGQNCDVTFSVIGM
jgi:hypothetical protein